MDNRITMLLGGVLCGGLLGAGPAAGQDYPATTLKLLGSNSTTTNWTLVTEPIIMRKVKEESGGKVVVNGIPNEQINAKGPEIFLLLKNGVYDMAVGSAAMASGTVPENDGFDIAGSAQNLDVLKKVVDAWLPTLSKAYDRKLGAKLMAVWPSGPQIVWCSTPISGFDDLKGKRIRVAGKSMADFFAAVGSVPVTIAFGEVVPSLQRNVIDCAVTGSHSGNLSKWTEVTTHVYPLTVAWAMNLLIVNNAAWGKLDARVRTLLEARAGDMSATGWGVARAVAEHGVWCSTGDSRCDVKASAPQTMTVMKLKLVQSSPEDDRKRLRVLEQSVLPKFAKACGGECTAAWNASVGKVLDVKAAE